MEEEWGRVGIRGERYSQVRSLRVNTGIYTYTEPFSTTQQNPRYPEEIVKGGLSRDAQTSRATTKVNGISKGERASDVK